MALEVLSYVFGGSNNSQLFKQLVINEGVAAGVRSYYSAESLNDSSFTISATPRPSVDLDAIEKSIDQEIARLLKDGVTDEEVRKAILTLKGDAIYALDSQQSLAQTFGVALTTGGSVEHTVSWPSRLSEVTAQDVNAVARKVLQPERSVTGRLLPKEEG